MSARLAKLALALAATLALLAAPAQAEFGLNNLAVDFIAPDGTPATQAGSHPREIVYSFDLNVVEEPDGRKYIDGAIQDLDVEQVRGLAGNPTAVPRCSTLDFLDRSGGINRCPDSAAIGFTSGEIASYGNIAPYGVPPNPGVPVYLLEPSPGTAGKVGFWVQDVPITMDLGLSDSPPYNVLSKLRNIPGVVEVVSAELTVWGNPADPIHDAQRGRCQETSAPDTCPANVPVRPLLTLPRQCMGPLETIFRAHPWWTGDPLSPTPGGPPFVGSALTPALGGCAKLGFAPEIAAAPTTDHASSPSGMDFSLLVDDEGLDNPLGTAHSDVKKTVVTLPEGVTLNPSVAEGLLTCTPDQYAAERVDSGPGEGCPEASKVGRVEVESPLLEGKLLHGALFVATQDDPATTEPGAENPFDTLIALYVVIKDPGLGVIVKQAGKVEPDPRTGQLISTFDDIPQVPFSDFRLHFREGGRSPLITPDGCGTYTTVAELTPWANPAATYETTSSFQITRGVGGGPCPPAGTPPFAPGFEAGSLNNTAGAHSPFYLRLTRSDGEQDMTRFSSILPPGVTGKLAGVAKCPDAAIEAAKAKTGRQELAAPSCPAASQIGRTEAGAGVGSQLTYVPGSLYLAGPYKGAPLSVVAITPAVAGPFDAGTVLVRVALTLNPVTAEVIADGAASDPIPHILKGIPLKVRDLRVHVDRPNFILNPTGCDPSQVRATLWGGGLDPFSGADDAPVALATRFQAANCALLGFKPRLSFRLKGGTKRGGHPALRSVFRPRPGDANTAKAVVRFPRSTFLDQGHIRTICTRVQFAQNACPPGAIYGKVRAFTPLLEEPFEGPAYLRSSDNKLPDLVFDLHGLVDIEAAGRIDSFKGGIRVTFPSLPDAPVSKVIIDMAGGKKGLIVNSRDVCNPPSRAQVELTAHNAKQRKLAPVMRAGCRR